MLHTNNEKRTSVRSYPRTFTKTNTRTHPPIYAQNYNQGTLSTPDILFTFMLTTRKSDRMMMEYHLFSSLSISFVHELPRRAYAHIYSRTTSNTTHLLKWPFIWLHPGPEPWLLVSILQLSHFISLFQSSLPQLLIFSQLQKQRSLV